MKSLVLFVLLYRVSLGSAEWVRALAGDDVILPCVLNASAVDQTVAWSRKDLGERSLHFYRDGRDSLAEQNAMFRGRTAMFSEEMKMGNVSVKLNRVRLSDAGDYTCFLPKLISRSVRLDVGAVSLPDISIRGTKDGGVVLQCESGGWYPEPEVEWLDSEGHVLSAGPTETLKDPDGTYTVRRQVTVVKTATNRFTCRVQQQHINQTRETEINVAEDIFPVPSWPMWITVVVAAIIIVMVTAWACVRLHKARISSIKKELGYVQSHLSELGRNKAQHELIRGAIDALRVPELQATKKASLVSMVEEVKEEIEKDIEKTQKQEEELQTKLNGIQQNAPCLKLCRRKEKEAAFVCMMDQEAAVVFSKEQEADVVCREEDQVDAACLNTRCGEEEEGAVGVSPEQVPLTAANREDTVPLTAANREDTVPLTEAKVDTVDVSPERFP